MGTREIRLNDSKGCGGVMRAAPAGLVGAPDPFTLGCDAAAITHSHPTGYVAAGFLALVIDRLVADEPLEYAVAEGIKRLERLEHLEREPDAEAEVEETRRAVTRAVELAGRGAPSAEALATLGGGWTAEEALAIALCASLAHPRDLEAGIALAVNHSGDSDSTGAIAGNLLGAALGRTAIPARWLELLELREVIEQVASDLA